MSLANEWSAETVVRLIAAGEATAETVTRACLERIAARENDVGAWIFLDPDAALAAARRCDRGAARGPLRGLPIGIKDIMDTADMPAELGSSIYAGRRPDADAACVALLKAAGAIILGKTVTTEFAAVHPGKTRHPLAPGRTPGGSSSGSAAAVADKMVPVALGTQTMGSLIRPAAYCGAVGFKPSFGLINRAGIKAQAESIDTVGIIGRSVGDVALVGAVLMGAPPALFAEAPAQPPRIALYRGPDWTKVEPAAERSLDETSRRLARAGARIVDAGTPQILRDALDAQLTIVIYELARAYAYECHTFPGKISAALTGMIEAGQECPFTRYIDAQRLARGARRWFAEAFAEIDLWITVSAHGEAPEGLGNTGDPVMNRLWSLLHGPVVTLPVGQGPNGLPLGIQLLGPSLSDAALIGAARWIERALA